MIWLIPRNWSITLKKKNNSDWLDKNVFMSKILKLCHAEYLKVYVTLGIAGKSHHYYI